MSQQDNFGSGFLIGTLFGGVIGGIVGAVVTSRIVQNRSETDTLQLEEPEADEPELISPSEDEMEVARLGLEDKIAQLNSAIDDVRERLGGIDSHAQDSKDVGKDFR